MQKMLQDMRYGLRILAKRPGFTAVAVLALALGIGANTAIFSVVNAVLLSPLPFAEPDRLVSVWETNQLRGYRRGAAAYPNFADFRSQNSVFEAMSSFHPSDFILTGFDEASRLQGAVVNADLFPMLGVAPKLGRTFLPEEDQPGNAGRVVLLGHRLWQQRFSGDPGIIGRAILLGGRSYTVVGVMPDGFQFPIQNEPVELWTTVAVDAEGKEPITSQRGAHYMGIIARLKSGVTVDQAQADLSAIASRLEQQYPDSNAHRNAMVEPAIESLIGDVRPALLILLGAVGCVLLIACANVANLLLARATTRHKEMALRSALGANRLRVVRQLLTESVMLSLAGGALGLLLALWSTELLVTLSKDDIPRASQIGVDARVLGFTLLVSVLTGVIFGLVPALQSSNTDLAESLKEGGRSSTAGTRRNRLRSILVVTEVTVAMVLLVGAGLLIKSLGKLNDVNPGFNPKNVLAFNIGLSETKYKTQQQTDFYRELISRIGSLPGVQSASAVLPLPLSGDRVRVTFETEGRPIPKGDLPATEYRSIGLNYFRTMGIPMLSGRDFTLRDDKNSAAVIIINDAFAQKNFPGEDPVGKHVKPGITTDDSEPPMREIVGVVGNVKHLGLRNESDPECYVPHAQVQFDSMTIVAKTVADPRSVIAAAQAEVRAMDKDLPIFNEKSLEEYVAASVAQPRFNTLLLTVFAALALVLTVVGLYGVISYSVVQRTHEIGIRMALGAKSRDVLTLVVGHGMALAAIGVSLGLGAAFAASRVMANLLYGVSATDPLTFAGVAVVLLGSALGACSVPARRAMRVDPMVALRYE